MKRPSAKSSVSPGRIGKNSPHSTKTMSRLIQNSSAPKRSSSQFGSIQSMPSSSGVTRLDRSREALTRVTLTSDRLLFAGMHEDERAPYDPMPHGPPEVGRRAVGGAWPEGEQWDADLLRDGDRRNVVDRYRYWTMEAIVADLDTRRHDFHVAIENWQHDFNIGTIVRTANAFLAARGPHRRQPPLEPARRDGHRPLPARPPPPRRRRAWRRTSTAPASGGRCACSASTTCPGSLHLETMELPRRVCFLFGQEGPGPVGVGARGLRRHLLDRAVRLDPLDQRQRGGRDRDAHLGPGVRRPVRRRRLARLIRALARLIRAVAHWGDGRCVAAREFPPLLPGRHACSRRWEPRSKVNLERWRSRSPPYP